MVDIVKNIIAGSNSRNMAKTASLPSKAARETRVAEPRSDSVEIKSAENQAVVKQMASAAPIDDANVNRIKEAIKRGEYPIDLDRVSDALMEAYREMKS
jgi:negative regulator of flagellin synthesis FlgM